MRLNTDAEREGSNSQGFKNFGLKMAQATARIDSGRGSGHGQKAVA